VLDLTGLPALDLAIGLAFIFFLLATLAATIQEFLAAALGLRARTLEQGVRSMLEDPEKGWAEVDKFYDHELVRSLYRTPKPKVFKKPKEGAPAENGTPEPGGAEVEESGKNTHVATRNKLEEAFAFFKRTGGPSYLSPRTFALVVLDNVAPAAGTETIFDKGEKALDELPAGLRKRLLPLVTGPEKNIEAVRTSLEAWYDDTMARVSGWYKRKTQIILIVIGILLVPAINANTIKMGERLWKDTTVRAAVVAQAQSQANDSSDKTLGTAADDAVVKVGIPMGWRGAAVPKRTFGDIAMAFGGWALTILAISLGAPFWFDTLSKFSRLRSSGKPETPLPASGSGKANERILTPPQVPTVVVQQEAPPAPEGE
jgi:hypothetical protein